MLDPRNRHRFELRAETAAIGENLMGSNPLLRRLLRARRTGTDATLTTQLQQPFTGRV